jgi:hypothetical protein
MRTRQRQIEPGEDGAIDVGHRQFVVEHEAVFVQHRRREALEPTGRESCRSGGMEQIEHGGRAGDPGAPPRGRDVVDPRRPCAVSQQPIERLPAGVIAVCGCDLDQRQRLAHHRDALDRGACRGRQQR